MSLIGCISISVLYRSYRKPQIVAKIRSPNPRTLAKTYPGTKKSIEALFFHVGAVLSPATS